MMFTMTKERVLYLPTSLAQDNMASLARFLMTCDHCKTTEVKCYTISR